MKEDAALLEAWNAGDRQAGSALLERHFDSLCRFFRSKAEDAVDDLIQATLLSAVASRERLRSASSFRAYLFTIARNELFDHFKRRGVAGDPGVSKVEDLAPSPSSVLAQDDEYHRVLRALQSIPLDLQIALELHYWERLSTAELAEALGIPQGTAKSRLRRARQAVRDKMSELPAATPGERDGDLDLDAWAAGLARALRP